MEAHSKLKQLQPCKLTPTFQTKHPEKYAFEKHR